MEIPLYALYQRSNLKQISYATSNILLPIQGLAAAYITSALTQKNTQGGWTCLQIS